MESSLVMQELLRKCNDGEKRKDVYLDRMCSMIEREDPDLCDEAGQKRRAGDGIGRRPDSPETGAARRRRRSRARMVTVPKILNLL